MFPTSIFLPFYSMQSKSENYLPHNSEKNISELYDFSSFIFDFV